MLHAMTIDVEDYFHVAAFNDVIAPEDWGRIKSRVEANTYRFLELIDAKNVKATFFMLGWVADKHPALVREIAALGHEIACHGYSHQLIYRQSPEVFREETLRSKSLLEDQAQTPIKGYRAASYSVTEASLWALDTIAEAGFTYDSSIYPIKHDNYGLQGGPETPYQIRLQNGVTLLEFPITTARVAGMSLPVGGGGYFRIYPYWLTERLLKRRCGAVDAPFVFYLHPWELDPEQPRVEGARALSRFRHYTNLHKVGDRLTQLMTEFSFAPMCQVLEQLSDLPEHSYA